MNQWENDLGAQWMPLKYKLADVLYKSGKKKGQIKTPGKIVQGRVKLAMREVKLHEIVFPKEYEEAVMGLINPSVGNTKYMGWFSKFVPRLIRFLGLKKPLQKWEKLDVINSDGVACLALGTKEDVMNFDLSKPVQSQGIIPQENL